MKNIICAIMSEMSRKQEFYRESTRGLGLALMMMIARMNSNVAMHRKDFARKTVLIRCARRWNISGITMQCR